MNEMTKITENAITDAAAKAEADRIGDAAQEEAGYEKLLKFNKGIYECGESIIPQKTRFVAHCVGWVKCWIKFVDKKCVDRKMFRVADGKRVPDREELDDNDRNRWPMGPDDKTPSDPWVYQYLLPMEDETGELVVFVTSSVGGKRAVADLCKSYARRVKRTGVSAQPVIALDQALMPTKAWGDVPRPHFEIVGWNTEVEGIRNIKAPDTLAQEHPFDDQIPF
jgi:hypothetical protein